MEAIAEKSKKDEKADTFTKSTQDTDVNVDATSVKPLVIEEEKSSAPMVIVSDVKKELKGDDMINRNEITGPVILDLLGMMNSIVRTNHNTKIPYTVISFKTYKRELAFKKVEKIDPYFEVKSYGTTRRVYLHIKPLTEAKFNDLDSFVEFLTHDCLDVIIAKSLEVLSGNEAVVFVDNRMENPDARGFPYKEFDGRNVDMEILFRNIKDLLQHAVPIDNNWRRVNLFRDEVINEVSERLIYYGVHIMRDIRNELADFMRMTNYGIEHSEVPPLCYQNDLFNVVSRNGWLPRIMRYIPYSLNFCSQAVIALTAPVINLSSPDGEGFLRNLGVSQATLANMTGLYAAQMTPQICDEIGMWVNSIIVPGYIEFKIDGIGTDENVMNIWSACIAKLTFVYHDKPRFRNIQQGAMTNVDQVFWTFLKAAQLIVPNPPADKNFPLVGVIARRNDIADAIDAIATRPGGNGNGWACDVIGPHRMVRRPNERYYPGMMNLYNYGINCADKDYMEANGVSELLDGWRTYNAIVTILEALKKVKDSKITNGITQLFKAFANRLASFYVRLNDYLRLHWDCGFRYPERDIDIVLDEEESNIKHEVINVRGLTVLFSHVDGAKGLERSTHVITQIKAETALSLDLKLARSRQLLLENAMDKFQIDVQTWSQRFRALLFFNKDSILHTHLENIPVGGIAKKLLDNLNLVEDDYLMETLEIAQRYILEKPQRFGFTDSIFLKTEVKEWTEAEIREASERDEPLINNLFERPEDERTIRMLKMRIPRGDVMFQLQALANRDGVVLRIPVAYDVKISNENKSSESCFSVNYVNEGRYANERNNFILGSLTKRLTFVDQNCLTRLDNVLFGLDSFEKYHVTNEDINHRFISWDDFVVSIPRLFVEGRILRNDNVMFKSMFELVTCGITVLRA